MYCYGKAEALIEIGEATGLEEARKIINRIRLRAKNSPYVKDFKHSEQDAANYLIGEYPAEGWSQDFARKALRWERRMEFAMEGDRFFDLVRWGIAAETMNSYISVEQNKRVYYRGAQALFVVEMNICLFPMHNITSLKVLMYKTPDMVSFN